MVGAQGSMDIEMLEENRRCPRIFREYQIRFFQDLNGPEGHVIQITDRGRDYVETARHFPIPVSF